jgi:hypothetical protein
MKRGIWIGKMVVIGIVAIGVFGLVTMQLWNWLVPTLFSGPVINFWQTLGLLLLSKIIFGLGGKGPGHNPKWGYWKQRWNSMTPEERERFKQKMKDKWCYRESTQKPRDIGTNV